jgi:CPA2 family monovalent cation:H+ antiporter-2
MHEFNLVATLAGALSAALVFGYLTHRAGLSPIAGYLIAGLLVGPYTPGFVADTAAAEQLAEVGVILLMFGVGLQFHVEELLAVKWIAIPGAIAQSAVATLLAAVAAHAFGWSWGAGIVFGIALAVASTVVLIRVLSDHNALHSPAGHIAVGWLVVEDLFTVVVLVVLPAVVGGGERPALWLVLLLTAAKVAVLGVLVVLAGGRAIPRLLDYVAATHSRELFTLTVLALALGIAVVSAVLFGVSMALGAFLAGLVVGRSEYSLRAASDALPMRDAFAVLFFVSVGMLLDPAFLTSSIGLLAATLGIVLIGKPVAAIVAVRMLGYPFPVALSVAIALAQIGEFSFILAALGRDLGVLPATAMNAIVAVSIVSIVLNPVLYRIGPSVQRRLATHDRLWRLLNGARPRAVGQTAARRAEPAHRAVVIGYGPTGQTLTRLLKDNDIEPTVIELNADTTRRLRDEGIRAVYGDAAHRATLEAAGVPEAGALILSTDVEGAAEVIRTARELNPAIRMMARTSHLRQIDTLRQAGAETVFSGEGEVALALTEAILDRLGATRDQIDRERARVHAEFKDLRN